MNQVDRAAVHAFLDSLVAGQSPEEKLAILKDIMVDEFCFNGLGDEQSVTALEADIHAILQRDPGKKISCIKDVREKTGMGLAEAKAFVETLQPGHPTYGINPGNRTTRVSKSVITEQFLKSLGNRLNAIAKTYGKPEPF
jgi:ribosomal protein L7/L12